MPRNCIDLDFIQHLLSTFASFGHFLLLLLSGVIYECELMSLWHAERHFAWGIGHRAWGLGLGMRASIWLLPLELGRDSLQALCLAKLRLASGDGVRLGCHYCVHFRSQISGDYFSSQCPLDVPSLTY